MLLVKDECRISSLCSRLLVYGECKVKDPTTVRPGGVYSHTLPIRVCAAQRGRDFEGPDLERGVHFRGVF